MEVASLSWAWSAPCFAPIQLLESDRCNIHLPTYYWKERGWRERTRIKVLDLHTANSDSTPDYIWSPNYCLKRSLNTGIGGSPYWIMQVLEKLKSQEGTIQKQEHKIREMTQWPEIIPCKHEGLNFLPDTTWTLLDTSRNISGGT